MSRHALPSCDQKLTSGQELGSQAVTATQEAGNQIPIWDPTWTVIELATGRERGPFSDKADIALCLAFAKLHRA